MWIETTEFLEMQLVSISKNLIDKVHFFCHTVMI